MRFEKEKQVLSKVEYFFYITVQLRVLGARKLDIYFIRAFSCFIVLLMFEYLYSSLERGELSLFSRGTFALESKPGLFWFAFSVYTLCVLAGIWFGTLGTTSKAKEQVVKKLLKERQQLQSSEISPLEGRFVIYVKAGDFRVVDSEVFTARDQIHDLLKNGYEYKINVAAASEEQALSEYKKQI